MAQQSPEDIQHIISGLLIRIRRLETSNRGAIMQGLAVNRPATPTTASIYYATNTKVLSVWNTSTDAWNTVSLT